MKYYFVSELLCDTIAIRVHRSKHGVVRKLGNHFDVELKQGDDRTLCILMDVLSKLLRC